MTILARFVAFAWLLTAVVSAQGTDPLRLYNEALSRETTLRVELTSATAEPRLSLATRRRLRTLVGAYRDLARLFPTSGIADKALWQAAMLAGDTYTTWGDPTDRSAALRAFETLTGSFPNSSLVRQVPAQTRRLWDVRVRVAEPGVTADAVPAVAASSSPTPSSTPTATRPAIGTSGLTTAVAGNTAAPPTVLRPPRSAPANTSAANTAATHAPGTANAYGTVAVAPGASAAAAAAPANEPPAAVTLAALMAITHERVAGAVRITLQLDKETAFQSDSLVGPPRVFVDLKNTRILERLRDAVIPVADPIVQRIRVGRQPGNLTRVVLDLGQGRRFSAYSMYGPYRVVIDVEAPEARPTAAADVLAPATTTAEATGRSETVAATTPTPSTPATLGTSRNVARVVKAAAPVTPTTPATSVDTPAAAATARVRTPLRAPATAPAVVPVAVPVTVLVAEAITLPIAAPIAIPVTVAAAIAETPGTTTWVSAPRDLPLVAPPTAIEAADLSRTPPTIPAYRTTPIERQMQSKAVPRRLQVGDTTAAVEAMAASRPATTEPAVIAAPAVVNAEAGAHQGPPVDLPVSLASSNGATPAPGSASRTARGDYSLSRQLGLGVARVVIDAGHGGHDPGALVKGLTEASLVLDIALRLEQLLRKQPGVDVVLTRRTDAYVPLEERTDIANRAGADLFVSIHANASANPRARGVETYVLNFATSSEAETVAARENSGSARTMRNLPDIVKTIALNNKVDESRELARFVQNSLHSQLRKGDVSMRNLGVKQAPFMVLIGATMPAILTEVAFVTNQDDASHMKIDKYRQDVAEALLAGITRYQQSLKKTGPTVATQQRFP